ncbi:MAG: SDR family oxidoreductase [Anaerolineae bacterium]|nr:SDR family oxidoreductase [Anaerolineae bacterium]
MELQGAVAVVTGAARGLGRAIAEALIAKGAAVALVDILREPLEATARALSEVGRVLPIVADVAAENQVTAMAARVRAELGPIDILINNAGSLSAIGPIWEAPKERWRQDMTVNLWGTYLCTRACVSDMLARDGGYVISIVGAGVDPPHLYRSAYDCSKAGVVKLMETLAKEGADFGIVTFCVFPGAVYTAMTQHMLESPEGRNWLPTFREIFEQGRDRPIEATAQRVVELVSGRADRLSGRYIRAWVPLEELLAQADDILSRDTLTLRLHE